MLITSSSLHPTDLSADSESGLQGIFLIIVEKTRRFEATDFSGRCEMKRCAVVFVALLLTVVLGCDGDGDGAVDSTEPSDVPDSGPEPEVLGRGTETIPAGNRQLLSFTVSETGALQGRITWSGEPDEMYMFIFHSGSATFFDTTGSSPLFLNVEVTQAMLDQSDNFNFTVGNLGVDPVEVEYRVRFTPDN
jgi:hypothetical protein